MKKLSKAQGEVVRLMREGWELGKSEGMSGGAWLQKNGVGRGGETKTISISTYLALYTKRIIAGEYTFPTSKYSLTELGKNVQL